MNHTPRRQRIAEAKRAAKDFLQAVKEWEEAHPSTVTEYSGFGNRHSGMITHTSLILTRRLADMRRF